MRCNIVKNLLSDYVDSLKNEEINAEIKEHMNNCDDCRNFYENISTELSLEPLPEDYNVDFLKKLKSRIRRRNIIIVISTCIVLLVGFVIFAKNHELVLPFDAARMSVEPFTAAFINEDGTIIVRDKEFAIGVGWIPEDYDNVREMVRIAYKGINNIGECSRGRLIDRNGEKVRVVYYSYTKTLWDSLFIDSDLQPYSESGYGFGENIYGDGYQSADYKPQMIEIYYLPIVDIPGLDNLSDEEYDSLRETIGPSKGISCDLIWSGVN